VLLLVTEGLTMVAAAEKAGATLMVPATQALDARVRGCQQEAAAVENLGC